MRIRKWFTLLIACIRFFLAVVSLVCNLVICSSIVFLLLPLPRFFGLGQNWFSAVQKKLQRLHSANIAWILLYVSGVRFSVNTSDSFLDQGKYIMVVNHQSGVDILVLLALLPKDLPLLKFFLKKSLAYIPFLGWFCYVMGYLFVDRVPNYASLADAKRILCQQRARLSMQCKSALESPTTLVLFVEGTRFSPQDKLGLYRHVLQPQSTGLALALEQAPLDCQGVIDTTIFYAQTNQVTPWTLLSGLCNTIHIDMRTYPCKEFYAQDILKNKSKKRKLSEWLQAIWVQKNEFLSARYAALSCLEKKT